MSYSFEKLTQLNVGDIAYECQYGMNLKFVVKTKPVVEDCDMSDKVRRQVTWTAENVIDGSKIDYLVTEGMEHYGSRIYSRPEYCRFDQETGEVVCPLFPTGEERFKDYTY